jgi:hypothetical protein
MVNDHDWEWESSELEGQGEYTVWAAGEGAAEGQLEKIAVKGELLHFAHGGVGAKGAVPVRRKELAADGFNWEGIAFKAGCELHDVNVSEQKLKCVSFMGVKFVGTADFSGTCIVLKLRLILRSLNACVCFASAPPRRMTHTDSTFSSEAGFRSTCSTHTRQAAQHDVIRDAAMGHGAAAA